MSTITFDTMNITKTDTNTNTDTNIDPNTYSYDFLLNKIYHNSESAASKNTIKLTDPVVKYSNAKTCVTNFNSICSKLNRTPEHVKNFIDIELKSTSSLDGNKNLIINGRYDNGGKIKNTLTKYKAKYVKCEQCKSLSTNLEKQNKINYIKCNACMSTRSVVDDKQ